MEKLLMKNPPHPGEILLEDYMHPLGLSVTALANVLHVSRKSLSQIINGRSGISPLMAVRLSRAFNTSPMYWLGMQEEFDLAKILASDELENEIQSIVQVA